MGVDGWNLAVARLGLTAIISLGMFALLERPIRSSTRPVSTGRAVAIAIGSSMAVVAAATLWVDPPATLGAAPAVLQAPEPAQTPSAAPSGQPVPANPSTPNAARPDPVETSVPPAVARLEANALSFSSGTSDESVALDADEPHDDSASLDAVAANGPTTIAVFGDSVPAWLLRDAARAFERRDVILVNGANEACDGAVALPVGRDRRQDALYPPDDCLEWTQSYPATLAALDRSVDVGLLVIGQAPTVDRYVDERWRHPCDAGSWYLDDVRERIQFLRSSDVEPVIALPARFGRRAVFILPDDHAERISCVRTSLMALALEQSVTTVDLDGLLCVGDDCDGRRRGDGVHVDPEVAGEVLDELVDLTLATR